MVDAVLARAAAARGRAVTAVPPRFPLAVLPTPLVEAPRIAPGLLVKRDDLIGFGVAGNKTRPLEYLVGAALAAAVPRCS